MGDISDDHHRELQPLCRVDAQDLYHALCGGASLSLPGSRVAQAVHVLDELAHPHDPTGKSVAQEFGHVACSSGLPGLYQRRPIVGGIEEGLDHICHRGPSHPVMEIVDDVGRPQGADAIIARKPVLRLLQYVPQGGNGPYGAASLAESIESRVRKSHGRRPQQSGQGQIVRGVGHSLKRVEQVPDLRAAVETPARHGEEGHPGALEGVLVSAKGPRSAAQDGDVTVVQRH